MRTCVIFNPAARGNKARRFRRHLDVMAAGVAFKATAGPGDAQRLAAEAVEEGYEVVVAAGGDGTLNEVLNGIAATPGGLDQVRLGVLPLGTVNVFARELKISLNLRRAWEILRRGNETRIDLACAEYQVRDRPEKRYFAQLAGAGLDARAIELVSWQLKKKAGPLAYVVAGLRAMFEAKPKSQSLPMMKLGESRLFEWNENIQIKSSCSSIVKFLMYKMSHKNFLTVVACRDEIAFRC